MWKPVSRPCAAAAEFSSVSSESVSAAWKPNEPASCGSLLRPAALQPADVLFDARACAVHAVAVGDLVAQARAQSGLLHGIRDDVQAAVDRVRAGMVVDQGRAAVLDRVHEADKCAVADILIQERQVQLPPEASRGFR